MTYWEYKLIAWNPTHGSRLEDALAGLGREGWEMVSVFESIGSHFFVFKRRLFGDVE